MSSGEFGGFWALFIGLYKVGVRKGEFRRVGGFWAFRPLRAPRLWEVSSVMG